MYPQGNRKNHHAHTHNRCSQKCKLSPRKFIQRTSSHLILCMSICMHFKCHEQKLMWRLLAQTGENERASERESICLVSEREICSISIDLGCKVHATESIFTSTRNRYFYYLTGFVGGDFEVHHADRYGECVVKQLNGAISLSYSSPISIHGFKSHDIYLQVMHSSVLRETMNI